MGYSKKILFIAANPNGYETIEWELEHKAIIKVLKNSQYEVSSVLARAMASDLDDYAKKKFWLIHFSGHGCEGGKLIFEDENREGFIMRKDDFLNWLSAMNGLKCVFLSACETDELAAEIEGMVDYAIGFKGTILNEDAIEFCKAFYESLTRCETLPFAYKDARMKLRRRKYQGASNVVLKSKYNYIMSAIYEGKTKELKAQYAENEALVAEIDLIQQEVNRMKAGGQKLFMELLRDNPYPRGVLWFDENMESLAFKLSHIVLNGKSEYEQKYFALDLKVAFNLLRSALVTFDLKGFTKANLKDVTIRVVKTAYYKQAFDLLPTLVPDTYSDEFIAYLRENCTYIKGLF